MEADIRWLDDPKVFRVGQLPAHSDHPIYGDVEEAAEGKSSLVQSLDGNWEFAYSVNAASRPVDFYRDNAGDTEFETIPVLSYPVTTKFIISIPCIPGRGKFTAARLTRWEKDWQKVLSAKQSIIL